MGYQPKDKPSTGRAERYGKRQRIDYESEIVTDAKISDEVPKESKPSCHPLLYRFLIYILLSIIRRLRKELAKEKSKNKKYQELQRENHKMKIQIMKLSPCNLLKTDDDVQFYTGIDSLEIFNTLHSNITGFVRRRWRGLLNHQSFKFRRFTKCPKMFGPSRLLSSRDEFLFTLMRLRLGLLTRDLSKRFGISTTLGTMIFNSWLTAIAKVLGSTVYWPPKETIRNTMPKRYRQIPDLRAIIDCTEIFLETPKGYQLQQKTWSDYKHHNTGKCLIAVAPNSAITFISKVYGGRVSDKQITIHSKFLDLLEPHDLLQADRGFMLSNECAARMIHLQVPPGKRGSAQMTSAATAKTGRIVSLRILVEQVIRRLKTFRILKYEVPLNLTHSLNKILIVCSALCNLKKPIYTS